MKELNMPSGPGVFHMVRNLIFSLMTLLTLSSSASVCSSPGSNRSINSFCSPSSSSVAQIPRQKVIT
uniref:Putative secreted protein n=1 Tax=Ixodes ricinus TaxID=34613 RepID=A0A6B0U145_IXORI